MRTKHTVAHACHTCPFFSSCSYAKSGMAMRDGNHCRILTSAPAALYSLIYNQADRVPDALKSNIQQLIDINDPSVLN